MRVFPRPKVVVSKCIEHENVRWDGQIIRNKLVSKMKKYVDLISVCPEVGIGLGIPRGPIRLVQIDDDIRVLQPDTGIDFTGKMKDFTGFFLESLNGVDGFILKGRSPSCGVNDTKLYPNMNAVSSNGKTSGIFSSMILERFSHLPIEEEGRFENSLIREHFLHRVYTISSFRKVQKSNTLKALIEFHTENKLLLKTYNQHRMRVMGRIIANKNNKPIKNIINEYKTQLFNALKKAPRYNAYIYTLENKMGYFKKKLSSDEKQSFLRSLNHYREGKVPLIVPVNIMRSWINRFEEDYLARQTFFEPYPLGLIDIDSDTEAIGMRD